MLMNSKQVKEITKECVLVATKKGNVYNGSKLSNVEKYIGQYGIGFTVEKAKTIKYYVYKNNVISEEVYNGGYDIMDAVLASRTIKTVNYCGVWVTPIWQLELDTLTGDYVLKRVEKYHPITLSGNKLIVSWHGEITRRMLKLKIRRKMKEMIDTGKAELRAGEQNEKRKNNIGII